ncbi:hypothetical protein GRJ2_001399800 [Grus japonensis]|uniref:Uncharacterized protein n=1 Tax=Grus japonensis TaxID=30415 RepID=A0ABC9WW91_GRUJA
MCWSEPVLITSVVPGTQRCGFGPRDLCDVYPFTRFDSLFGKGYRCDEVNVLIAASITSCVAILIVIVYSSLTLSYGEEEDLSSALVHVIHTKFVLNKVVKGANVAMLAASIGSAFVVLAMAYLGCRSLPRCSCYDSVTGMVGLEVPIERMSCLQALGMKW